MVDAGELLEHAMVYGHGYGTPRAPVEQALAAGRDVLFDIDWQGTQQLREVAARRHGQRVHPAAVDWRSWSAGCSGAPQDTEAVVQQRLAQVAADVTHFAEYDYVLINSDFDASVAQVRRSSRRSACGATASRAAASSSTSSARPRCGAPAAALKLGARRQKPATSMLLGARGRRRCRRVQQLARIAASRLLRLARSILRR